MIEPFNLIVLITYCYATDKFNVYPGSFYSAVSKHLSTMFFFHGVPRVVEVYVMLFSERFCFFDNVIMYRVGDINYVYNVKLKSHGLDIETT